MKTVYLINIITNSTKFKTKGILTLMKTYARDMPQKLDRGPDGVTANQDVHTLTQKSSSI